MSALISPSCVLRFLMLALLMVSVVMKPVLAVECEIRDVEQMVVGESRMAAAETPDPNFGEDCCSVPNCNDCCAHTIALLPSFGVAPVPMTTAVLPSLSVDFQPIAFPVAFRPPIAA